MKTTPPTKLKCECYWYQTKDGVKYLIQCNKCGKNSDSIRKCPCHCHAGGNYQDCKAHEVIMCSHCTDLVSETRKQLVREIREKATALKYTPALHPNHYKKLNRTCISLNDLDKILENYD